MTEALDHKTIREKERADKIANFEEKLAALRLRRGDQNDKEVTTDNLFGHAVTAAESVFTTPAELAKYAIPYLLTTKDWSHYSFNSKQVLPLINKWKLTNRPQAVIAVMDYVARYQHWSGSGFVNECGALAKQYLPKDKQGVVFERVLNQRGYPIPRTKAIVEIAEFWAKTVQDYVPQDKWPTAYLILKQRLTDAVKRPSKYGVVDINTDKIERVAETLARFANALPLNAKKKTEALNDVTKLLTTPAEFYPDKEITEREHRFDASRKGIILFEAKRDLDASRLTPSDYDAVAKFVNDKDNSASSLDKITTLKSSAEKCLPEDLRTERIVTDVLQLCARHFTANPHNYILAGIAKSLSAAFSDMNLNDDQRAQIKQFFTKPLIALAVNGQISDEGLYDIFGEVAKLLSPAQRLSWAEEFIVTPFLNSDLSKNDPVIPFMGFLKEQFQHVVGKPAEQKIMATKHMASGYVAGKLIIAFGASTVIGRSRDGENLVLSGEKFSTRADAKESFTNVSSIPLIRKLYADRFDNIVTAIGLNREVA